jgi:cyclohexyl-isocyanide hydratase
MAVSIGFLLFPDVTQLDLTGPLQVLSRLPGASCHVVARTPDPQPSDCGLSLVPTATLADCPPLDVLVVPGGFGVVGAIGDRETLAFVRARGEAAAWLTSVCTGAFILGAAGLLKGKRATTHWAYRDLLPLVWAEPVEARVVRDGRLMTGGGVTAGIDFAFTLAAELAGPEVAARIRLGIEYDPPSDVAGGSPASAPPELTAALRRFYERPRAATREAIAAALG